MRYFVSVVVLVFVMFSGCGGDKSRPVDLPKLFPCKITATQEGQPLVGGTVSLRSVDTSAKYGVSSGTTDDTGIATLRTQGFIGAPAGKYKVLVTKIVNEELDKRTKRLGEPEKYNLVEKKYSDVETTDVEFEIVSGKNEFSIEVGKPVREVIKIQYSKPAKK
jgi:hypothetical protein